MSEYEVGNVDAINYLSQIFWIISQPGNLLLIALLVGSCILWARPTGSGRMWLTSLSVVLLLVTLLPVQWWVARPLEERFPLPAELPEAIDGIIVLGGIVQHGTSDNRGALTVSDNAERIMVAAGIAVRYPQARLLITGRDEQHRTLTAWFADIGLERDRVLYEPKSRNTYENAIFSKGMIDPQPDAIWLLVTSARHMPRAVGVFRKAGWPVIPYPVDYRTVEDEPARHRMDVAGSLARLGNVTKEWVGLVGYYLLDRSSELFPGPER